MGNLLSLDKSFYRTLLRIAIPIAIQNLIASSLNMVDTVMIGQMGETEIASVGLANQVFFLLNLFLFGVSSGAAIFTAQFWGKKDVSNIRRVLGLSLLSGVGVSFVFTLVAVLIPGPVLHIFSGDERVIRLGSEYLRIVGWSYMITAITFSYASVLRSTEQVRIPMMISIAALSINTLFNYILIFGHFGFPMLGVQGAAIATVLARTVEVCLMLGIVYKGGHAPAGRIQELLSFSWDFITRFFSTTVPVILNESLWALGVTMYSIVYAHMGTGVIASMNISSTIERIAMVLFFGMANACAVMIGNRIGAGEEEKAFQYAKRFSLLGPFLGVFMGIVLMLSANGILSVYHVSWDVLASSRRILFLFGLFMPIRIFNLINIVGILRSGGDTRFSLFIDTAGLWLIAVPLAFLGGLVWKLPLHWVYVLITLEEAFKLVLGVKRLVSRKWLNNLVRHMDSGGEVVPSEI